MIKQQTASLQPAVHKRGAVESQSVAPTESTIQQEEQTLQLLVLLCGMTSDPRQIKPRQIKLKTEPSDDIIDWHVLKDYVTPALARQTAAGLKETTRQPRLELPDLLPEELSEPRQKTEELLHGSQRGSTTALLQ
ncbi:hypothetical protein INR49_018273 [Caranx melampygus]|nr:hypothetical protein INR49_018273 [Caranx melampygus]